MEQLEGAAAAKRAKVNLQSSELPVDQGVSQPSTAFPSHNKLKEAGTELDRSPRENLAGPTDAVGKSHQMYMQLPDLLFSEADEQTLRQALHDVRSTGWSERRTGGDLMGASKLPQALTKQEVHLRRLQRIQSLLQVYQVLFLTTFPVMFVMRAHSLHLMVAAKNLQCFPASNTLVRHQSVTAYQASPCSDKCLSPTHTIKCKTHSTSMLSV